jgi:hypothetical protein
VRAFLAVLVVLLVAGCLADGPPTLRARNETLEVPESPSYPGLTLRGALDVAGSQLAIDAVARNGGNWTYRVEAVCGGPWTVELFRDGERLEMHDPGPQCLAYALEDFGPNASLSFSTQWDGTVWDAEERRQVDALPGEYVWSVRFVAYHPDGYQLKRYDLDFNVTVS